ncbi:MAG: hypothetical protein ABIO64_12805 [Burkholderiaceae bacterium]
METNKKYCVFPHWNATGIRSSNGACNIRVTACCGSSKTLFALPQMLQ